ncbi:MAG: Lrp/AsnC family transcriptional regulator [Halarchaeum sp.]
MTDAGIDDVDRAIVAAFQRGFPVVQRPFEPAAHALRSQGVTVDAATFVARVERLLAGGTLTRFGPVVDADAIGGRATLAAMHVPAPEFDSVVAAVNDHRAVVESHEFEGARLNLWFSLAAADPTRVAETLDAVAAETGYRPHALPATTTFRDDATLPVDDTLAVDVDLSDLGPNPKPTDATGLTAAERTLLAALGDGLPLSETPYRDVAARIERDPEWVVETLRRLNVEGKIGRVGAVVDPRALGYTANATAAWDVPADAVAAVGDALADCDAVRCCHEREPPDSSWPYNVYASVLARTPEERRERVERAGAAVAVRADVPDERVTLDETRTLKRTGFRLAAHPLSAADAGEP